VSAEEHRPQVTAPETARRDIEGLVERFARNLDVYTRPDYKETQVRVEFIDPFFEALGWDVRNVRGYAEQYKDVVHEDAIKVSGATQAPDYCFRVGGVRKFFLEAKKPSTPVKGDVGPAYQLRRYAWSAKLPLSILTDFQEFAVYDCRQRPKPKDKAGVGRTLYLTFDEYLDRLDEIYGIFARDSVLKGSFDRYVLDTKRKRGTGEVDVEFLKEIEGWREELARNIALRNPALSVYELNFSVQRTIDRVIFLRMCEDRGIEGYGRLLALTGGPHIYDRMGELYREADEKYNSDLFDFKADTLTKSLAIDDKTLKPILAGLYYPDSPYEFSVLPTEILGQVYEQFLGKVIRLTAGHRAKVEEKPEVKKAGGVYYTPAYIVAYIVQQTVGRLIEGQTPQQISKLRIVDPACGSGSFLLGAYQRLLDYHRQWYEEHDPQKHATAKRPTIYQGRGGEWRLTTGEKKRLLLNSIFGVDIDRQAVEVTKLSLLLKVLEGENQETLGHQLSLWRERALPDLGENIKCGNSLIGPDYFEGQLLPDEAEMRRVNPFDWEKEFPEIMKAGGFDAVIGNPPYIQLSMEQYYSQPVAQYLADHFSSSMGRLNTFGLFLEQGLAQLTAPQGILSFIIPNTILTQGYYETLRDIILKRSILCIASYEYNVFRGAVVEPAILVIGNTAPKDNKVRIEVYGGQYQDPLLSTLPQTVFEETFKKAFSIKADADTLRLKHKVDNDWRKFTDLLRINQAIALKGDRSLSLHRARNGRNYYPVLDGRDIARYGTHWAGDFLEYDIERIHSCKRTDIFERDEKIFFRRVGEGIVATLDRDRFYALNTLVVVTPKPPSQHALSYVLGIFNSRLLDYYYRTFLKSSKRTFSEVQARQVGQLPLRTIDFEDRRDGARHDRMVALVERMLDLHKKLHAATIPADKKLYQRQVEATDEEIDALVYDLYGLTEEEIAFVEEASK